MLYFFVIMGVALSLYLDKNNPSDVIHKGCFIEFGNYSVKTIFRPAKQNKTHFYNRHTIAQIDKQAIYNATLTNRVYQ